MMFIAHTFHNGRYARLARLLALLASLLATALVGLAQGVRVPREPTLADAYKFFDEKVKKESEGRIGIGPFDLKTDLGKASQGIPFTLVVSFNEPCLWHFRSDGKTLSFQTQPLPLQNRHGTTNEAGALIVPKRGWGVFLFGDVFFDRTPQGWSATRFTVRLQPAQDDVRDFGRVTCSSNIKEAGFCFYVWAKKHNDQFIFNVSTNSGGTKELCDIGADGFDRNIVTHLRELNVHPGYLVCPGDLRTPAIDIHSLSATNVSYQLRSGTNVVLTKSGEVLLRCPIHHNVVFSDQRIGYTK